MSDDDALKRAADMPRRDWLARAAGAAGGLALVGAAYPFVASLEPSARARAAGAPVEADISSVGEGRLESIAWRGKPIWILRRTPAMLAALQTDRRLLTDPDSEVSSQQPEYARNATRSIRPEVFVAVGLCTHLGCIPNYFPEPGSVEAGWPGGFYCPCHGSKFDLAGRVFRGSPAPINLLVPPYRLDSATRLVVGVDPGTKAREV